MVLSYTNEVSLEFKDKVVCWWRLKLKRIRPNIANPIVNLWKDPWVHFMICWMIFDAYLTEISQCSIDEKKMQYFFREKCDFKDNIADEYGMLLVYRPKLKALSPILDTRPDWRRLRKDGKQEVYLRDEKDLEQTFRFVYQIRCNFFHGSIDSRDDTTYQLVDESAKFLDECIEHWLRGSDRV